MDYELKQPEHQATGGQDAGASPIIKPKKKHVHPVISIFAVLLVCLCIAWQYTRIYGMPKILQGQTNSEYLAQKAEESKGDWNKLSKSEQDKINGMTHGFGQQALKALTNPKSIKSFKKPGESVPK